MILNNEIDRIRFIRELLSAELPCEVIKAKSTKDNPEPMMSVLALDAIRRGSFDDYPDTPEATLGDHPSGFKDDCCE